MFDRGSSVSYLLYATFHLEMAALSGATNAYHNARCLLLFTYPLHNIVVYIYEQMMFLFIVTKCRCDWTVGLWREE